MSLPACILPDVLAPDLEVVFCGTAAGRKSAEVGAYYAGPGNKFWPTLHAVGLTPQRLMPHDFRRLLDFRLGLTDLAKYAFGADASLRRTDFAVQAVEELVLRYRPRILAFTSKRAAQEFAGQECGYGLFPDTLHGTLLFTLPSPSGLATRYWSNGVHWQQLAQLVRADHSAA